MRGLVYSLALPLLLVGCASAAPAASSDQTLCDRVRAWKATGEYARYQVAPTGGSDEGGLNYRFDLDGRHGLKSVAAECGAGSYSECEFAIEDADGSRYAYTDLSRFGLILVEGRYYLVYAVVGAKKGKDPEAKRVVELTDPPKTVCDQIGDYADLM